jgi:multiple sugar transport system permease protein
MSFHKFAGSITEPAAFVGLGNFYEILVEGHGGVYGFYDTLRTTFVYVSIAVSIEFILGLIIAMLLNRELRGIRVVRALLLLPMMTAPAVAGFIFVYMYGQGYGPIDYYLKALGLMAPDTVILADGNLALLALIVVDIWQWTPFMIMVLLAGLTALPKDPFEMAEIDGASKWLIFKHLTLPLLKPVIAIALLFRIMDAFKVFDYVYILTNGGPSGRTATVSFAAYLTSIKFFDVGLGSAFCLIIMWIILGISLFLIKVLKISF